MIPNYSDEYSGKKLEETISEMLSEIKESTSKIPHHMKELEEMIVIYECLHDCLPGVYRSKDGSRIDNAMGPMMCKIPFPEGFIENVSLFSIRQQWDVIYCLIGGSYRSAILTLRHMLEMVLFTYAGILDKSILSGNMNDQGRAMSFYDFVKFIMENDRDIFLKHLTKTLKEPLEINSSSTIKRRNFQSIATLLSKMQVDSFRGIRYQHITKVPLNEILSLGPAIKNFLKHYHNIDFEDAESEIVNEKDIIIIHNKAKSLIFTIYLKGEQSIKIEGVKAEEIDAQFNNKILTLSYPFEGDKAIRHLASRLSRFAHATLFRRIKVDRITDEDDADNSIPAFNSKRFHHTLRFVRQTTEMILSLLILSAWTDISYYSISRAFDFLIEFQTISNPIVRTLNFSNLQDLVKDLLVKSDLKAVEKDRIRVEQEEDRFAEELNQCSQCPCQHYPDVLKQGKCNYNNDMDKLYYIEEVYDW
jgi:hypothetical protein